MPDELAKIDSESIAKSDFSERFRDFRARAGLKQSELAALLDAHPNYISQIERGDKVPGKRLLKEFMVLEDSPTYRVGGVEYSPTLPPHQLPTEEPDVPSRSDPSLNHQDYMKCLTWLSNLFDKHPTAFRSVMVMIKAVHDQENQK